MHGLYLGLLDAGGNDPRPVESVKETVPVRNLLLRPEKLPPLLPWARTQGLGSKGMFYTEEDWVDEDAIAHRGPDD